MQDNALKMIELAAPRFGFKRMPCLFVPGVPSSSYTAGAEVNVFCLVFVIYCGR